MLTNIFKDKELGIIDKTLIVLALILIFSFPIMLLNPMNPLFHHLQVTEFVFVVFAVFFFLAWLSSPHLKIPKPGSVFYLGVLFLLVMLVSAFFGLSFHHSLLGCIKILYLFTLASMLYIVGRAYHLDRAYWCIFTLSFLFVIACALLGMVLLYCNIPNFFAEKARVIPIALGIESWISFVPRVTSLLKPTGNMLGAYLACVSLPVFCLLYTAVKTKQGKCWFFLLMFLVGVIGLLTMSRAFSGVLFSLYFTFLILPGIVYCQSCLRKLMLLAAVLVWLVLFFYSVIYPVHFKLHHTTDPSFKKPTVEMKVGEREPNPVYFLRKGEGLEGIKLQFNYGFVHYAWLKYAGFELFKQHPWFGVGIANYPLGVKHLADAGVVAPQLKAYMSAQSQYFTALAEFGLVGTVALLLAFIWLLKYLYSVYRQSGHCEILCMMIGLLLLALVALDVDVIAFRWLWGLIAMSLLSCWRILNEKNSIS